MARNKPVPRTQVANAILIHTPLAKLNTLLLKGHKGFDQMTPQELVAAAQDLLPADELTRLLPALRQLLILGLNRPPRDGDTLFSVLVTRDAGTESAEIYVYAGSEKEAASEALSVANENQIDMNFNEGNPRDDAYLGGDDCVEPSLIQGLLLRSC